MCRYRNKITNATEFILIDMYFPGVINDKPVLTKVEMEVYLIDDLKANILISTDVLTSYKFILDCTS